MQIIHLNANSFSMFPRVAMVQNDTARDLKMVLDDMTLSGSETGAVAIHRSDGSYYTIPATRVIGDNAFTADMSQALTQPGQTECQLKVTASDDTIISSYTFMIYVQQSTDGLSTEQLGVSPEELIEAASQLTLSDNDVKLALLQIAEKTVYVDEHGQDYYDALEDALYPPIRATSVTLNKNSLVFGDVGWTDTLVATISPNNVEDDTVYWGSSDKDVAVVSDGIVTSVGEGTAVITATCGTVHANASVLVAFAELVSITATYTQNGSVYASEYLEGLKNDLVVVATFDDSSEITIPASDYTLSGKLVNGTSTITVTYSEKTDTFNVTVSPAVGWYYPFNNSLASAGTLDFGFTGTANYILGRNGEDYAYYHKGTSDSGATTEESKGIYATGLDPSFAWGSGDFTIAFWFASVTEKKGHPLAASVWAADGGTTGTMFSNVTASNGWSVAGNTTISRKYSGITFWWYGDKLCIGVHSATNTAHGSQIQLTPPSSHKTKDWHHYAFTRSGATIRLFIDGVVVLTMNASTNAIYDAKQVLLGSLFTQTSANKTVPQSMGNGDKISDFYVVKRCKWTSAFDVNKIVYD